MRAAISVVLLACTVSGCVVAPYGHRAYGPAVYEQPEVVVQPQVYVAPRPYYSPYYYGRPGHYWRGGGGRR
ncbi:hypothetical protein J2X19_002851 [Rhodoferax ferrireducens]|uniref:Lipoprotein n=1 Tax=Rhodoferax ferrireducens TaxID=192843 RepID=A0ABU2CA07_9BURK|nr:hypothetical protein [Rhodoferax ferrireducens]MDR7378172.1 hypothetical protein [Rhodoferax ferrireducens]